MKTLNWTVVMQWFGNLNEVDATFLTPHLVGVICIGVSGVCGAIVGLEREKRSKPAGLRTLILICMGATVFTLASLLISTGEFSDPGRIAAQVVTGVGFLGAGAIIQERRAVVVGLTTGATIWTVAAIGVVVGTGYAAPGLVLSLLIFLILTADPCRQVVAHWRVSGETRACRLLQPSRQDPSPNSGNLGRLSNGFVDLRVCVARAESD